jgi:phage shock protein E
MMNTTLASAHPLRLALRRAVIAAALIATLGAASACSGDVADAAGGSAAELLPAGTMLIDVRTPAEFAEGHLEGAVNIPVELPTFPEQVARLDPDLDYLVYCRTGRRADIALDHMATIGLTGQNLGSVDQASAATGIRVIR